MSRARSGHAVDHDDYSDGMGEDYPSYNYNDGDYAEEEEEEYAHPASAPLSVTVVDKTSASKAAQATEREQALAAQRANQAEASARHAEAEKQRQALLVELEAAGIVSSPGLSNEQLRALLCESRERGAKFEAEKREADERDAIRQAAREAAAERQRQLAEEEALNSEEEILDRPVFDVPYDVWSEVFQWLTPIDITQLGSSAWLLHEIVTTEDIWRDILKRQNHIFVGEHRGQLYQLSHRHKDIRLNPYLRIGPTYFSLERSPAPFRWSALWSFRFLMLQLRAGELDSEYYKHYLGVAQRPTTRRMIDNVEDWKLTFRARAHSDLFHNEDTDPKVKEYARLIVNLLGKMGSTALKIFESIDFTAFSKKQAEAYGIPSTPDEIARLRSQCISASLDSSEENEQDLTQAKRFFFKGRDIIWPQRDDDDTVGDPSASTDKRAAEYWQVERHPNSSRRKCRVPLTLSAAKKQKLIEIRFRKVGMDSHDFLYGTPAMRRRALTQLQAYEKGLGVGHTHLK